VTFGQQITGEHPPVRQRDATAQSLACVTRSLRNAGSGRCGHLLLPFQVWPRPRSAPSQG
jgi:hypothetical protein